MINTSLSTINTSIITSPVYSGGTIWTGGVTPGVSSLIAAVATNPETGEVTHNINFYGFELNFGSILGGLCALVVWLNLKILQV